MKKILYGICGIGNGHIYRQLPLLNYLLEQGHQILVFAYGASLDYLKKYESLKVVEVWVPYYPGNKEGLDFSLLSEENKFHINIQAFKQAQQWLGRPDLVISDYEPNCAQYGYAYNCPVVTFDQQSKYLNESFPDELNQTSYQDEVQRLRMFFPVADRIACSFFKVEQNVSKGYIRNKVKIISPVLRKEVLAIKNVPDKNQYVVYISGQKGYSQSIDSIISVLSKRKEKFSLFLPKYMLSHKTVDNIEIYEHASPCFEKKLTSCNAIITTAGHGCLSEAMHLGIPVYAMPLNIYEQQLNAYIISKNNFGISALNIEDKNLDIFIKNIDIYRKNIQNDKSILLKEDGFNVLVQEIEQLLNGTA